MENNEKFLSLRNIELTSYINSKHQKLDLIELEAEKNAIENLLKRANEELFQYFLRKQDPLLQLLETHQKCSTAVNTFQKMQKHDIRKGKAVDTHSAELKKKFELFKDDMSIFLTNDRYFISSAVFDGGEIFLLLTNDLLFVGEKDGQKYKLKRSMNKEIVDLELAEDVLRLFLDGATCELKGSKVDVENFFECFQEVSYEFKPGKRDAVDYDFVEYCLETKKYSVLVEYLETLDCKPDDRLVALVNSVSVHDELALFAHGKILGGMPKFFREFFLARFKVGLRGINRLQALEAYVADVFAFVTDFSRELRKYCDRESMDKRLFLLVMEDSVRCALDSLALRFVNHCRMNNLCEDSEFVKCVGDKLEFDGLNLRYLARETDLRRPGSAGSVERAKTFIQERISQFLDADE